MSISHRTNRLKLVGTPAVEQLQNGRYQLTVNCTTINRREDWYSANKARIFPDFGSLQSAEMSIDGLAPRTGEAYTDMRLVSVQSSTQQELYIVTLVYQTLGASFVQVKDDTISYEESGLRRVTRQSIAKAGTDFQKTVGTTSISSQIDGETAVTCFLANYEVNDTDSYREVTEVYMEPGTLSSVEDFEGSQKTLVQETFAQEPVAPSGFSKAREEVSNVDGIPTKQFTFLKDDVELSRSEDLVGSQLAIVTEVFKPASDPTESGYSVARTEVSNVDGIPTKRFTFLKDDVELSRNEDKVGSQLSIVTEVFNPTSDPTESGYSVARTDISNVDGIPTKRFTFLKDNVTLATSIENKKGTATSGFALIREAIEVFKPSSNPTPTTTGAVLIGEDVSDVEGIPTKRFTFAKGEGEIIVDKRPAVSQLAGCQQVTVTTLGSTEPANPTGIIIGKTESESDGYKTFVVTAIQGTVEGIKQTYKDVIEIRTPGTVSLDSISKSAGNISGDIAIAKVTPPRTKTIAAEVNVEITKTPPETAELAYDLSDISCSVVSTSLSENFKGTDVFTTASGNTRSSHQRKTASMSARVQTYPACYLDNGSSSSGTFTYDSSFENTSTSPNSINTQALTSTTKTFCDGAGASSDNTQTTGIIKRNSRPIFTDLDGNTYYEVITWSV